MKNIIFCLICFCLVANKTTLAQIGINTDYPKYLFHIDAKRDNPQDAVPPLSAAQLSNDVIITSSGNMGIGTSPIASKLEIVTDVNGRGFRLQDGFAAPGLFLRSSDNSGFSQWGDPNLEVLRGTFPASDISLSTCPNVNSAYGLSRLNLVPGIWLIIIKGYLQVDLEGVCGIVLREHPINSIFGNILTTGANTATRDLHINTSGVIEVLSNTTIELAIWSYDPSALYAGLSHSATRSFWGFTAVKIQ